MTAEVGVLNTIGVALAADSAVSIGKDAEKIYTSANKIFQLSCQAPIAIMIYGNANIAGLPWETVIKTYREQLGTKRFDTVAMYAEDFFSYVESGGHGMFSQQQQIRQAGLVVYSRFEEVYDSLWLKIQKEIVAGSDIEDETIDTLLHEEVKKFLEDVRAKDLLPGFEKEDIATAEATYKEQTDAAMAELFREDIPTKTKRALRKLAAEVLCRKDRPALESGIVIAGFGEKEFTPCLCVREVEEFALGRLRQVRTPHESKIDDDTRALVVPFAQRDMVFSFMEGIQSSLLDFMACSTADLVGGVVDEIVDLVAKADQQIGKNLKKTLGPKLPKLLETLFAGWQAQREHTWRPVLQITGSLPKDEIAAMAEALVNLTKFRRRVTTDRETVGGPIDVAVITKGDGFVVDQT